MPKPLEKVEPNNGVLKDKGLCPLEPVMGGRNPPGVTPLPQIKIICGHSVFNENALVMSKKYGWTLETDFDPQKSDVYVVFGSHEIAHQLLEIQFKNNSNFGYIILNSEQIDSQFFKNKYYISLMKRNIVFDYNTLSSEYLKETFGIRVLSHFYFEFMQFTSGTSSPNPGFLRVPPLREYDVTFIGTRSEKRETILKDLKECYPDLKFYVDLDWKHVSPQSLTDILHKSKIVLNIPYYESNHSLETHRINKALACGCEVISLPSDEEDANEFYKDYITITDKIVLGVPLNPKLGYEHLVKTLSQKFNPHMLFIIEHIQKKLLSISQGVNPVGLDPPHERV